MYYRMELQELKTDNLISHVLVGQHFKCILVTTGLALGFLGICNQHLKQ